MIAACKVAMNRAPGAYEHIWSNRMTVLQMPNAALREIFAGVTDAGWHICSWPSLRASTFPGVTGWAQLKAWCAANGLECALCPSHSSTKADVQFHNMRPSKARAMVAPA